jgi:hypothetical protein
LTKRVWPEDLGIYDIGEEVTIATTFTNKSSGQLQDPTTVVATIRQPNAVNATPSVTNTGVGLYRVDFQPTMEGNHFVRFVGTGALTAANQAMFHARPRRV